MHGMNNGLDPNDPTVVAAFQSALLHQGLTSMLIFAVLSVAWISGGPALGGRAHSGPLVIPAHGILALTPVDDDLVLQQPSPYESRATVPLMLTFRHSGTVTIDAPVTGPGTP